jgi:hypothetical protein
LLPSAQIVSGFRRERRERRIHTCIPPAKNSRYGVCYSAKSTRISHIPILPVEVDAMRIRPDSYKNIELDGGGDFYGGGLDGGVDFDSGRDGLHCQSSTRMKGRLVYPDAEGKIVSPGH